MNTCEQAEMLRVLLQMGLAAKEEIIAWADDLIMTTERPSEWLLDLSLAANKPDYVIEEMLRGQQCDGDRTAAAFSALDRFAGVFRSGTIPPRQAAWMLYQWAVSSTLNDGDMKHGMVGQWVADEVEYGYTSEQDVVKAISDCLQHFASAKRAGFISPSR